MKPLSSPSLLRPSSQGCTPSTIPLTGETPIPDSRLPSSHREQYLLIYTSLLSRHQAEADENE